MWDLPGPGLEPMSPALAGGFLATVPPGESQSSRVLSTQMERIPKCWEQCGCYSCSSVRIYLISLIYHAVRYSHNSTIPVLFPILQLRKLSLRSFAQYHRAYRRYIESMSVSPSVLCIVTSYLSGILVCFVSLAFETCIAHPCLDVPGEKNV